MFWSVFVRSVAATVFVSIPTLATTVFWPGMVNPGSYAGPVSPFEQSVANSASVAEKFAVEKRGNLGNQALDSMTLLNHWQYTSSDLMEGYKSPEARCWSSGGRCWSPGARFWHGFAPVCGLDCGGNFQAQVFHVQYPVSLRVELLAATGNFQRSGVVDRAQFAPERWGRIDRRRWDGQRPMLPRRLALPVLRTWAETTSQFNTTGLRFSEKTSFRPRWACPSGARD